MRPAFRVAVAFALLAVSAPTAVAAEAGPLAWSPDPVPAETPIEVRFTPPDGGSARNVTLKVCLAEAGNATFCFAPLRMTEAGNGSFAATTDPRWGFPAGQQVGLNVTWTGGDNATRHWPMGEPDAGRAYVFFHTPPAEREAPAPPGLALLGLLAGAIARRFHRVKQTP